MADYRNWRPEDIWLKIRSGEIDYPTAGMCGGYAQANLVILPKKYADDFKEFAKKNPQPCPVLEIIEGNPMIHDMGEGANVVTDIPKYFVLSLFLHLLIVSWMMRGWFYENHNFPSKENEERYREFALEYNACIFAECSGDC